MGMSPKGPRGILGLDALGLAEEGLMLALGTSSMFFGSQCEIDVEWRAPIVYTELDAMSCILLWAESVGGVACLFTYDEGSLCSLFSGFTF